MKLLVFTNHRAIRDFIIKNYEKKSLLDKLLTIDEFEKRAQIFQNRKFIDDDQRAILLKEAADFSDFDLLKIEKDFLKFIKSSTAILKFFEELTKESVTFEDIQRADTYAEYDNHLNVLKILFSRYLTLLDERLYVDAINAPMIYEINDDYLKSFKEIHIFFEGYLSRYEVALFEKIAKISDCFLHISTSFFTKKMHDRFEGFELEANHSYTLNISKKEIAQSNKINKKYNIKTYSAPSRLMQIAAIKKAIFDILKKPHILPQKIALILPDEEFAELLSFYDYKNNFNYAMGFSFYNEPLYKKLKAIYELREEKNRENLLRAKRFEIDEKLLEESWEKVINFNEIVRIFETFGEEIGDKEKNHLYLENIHALKKIKKELIGYPLKEVFHLFLNRLATIKVDMTSGGNITVMGALESRGVEFDAVIVCDFNEGFVPKENKKDLYLNSAVRKHSNLPTRKDRQNLQLDLYHNLFLRSKEAAIIYVKSEDSIPSSFLKQLQIEKEPIEVGYEYAPLLYENNPKCEQEKSLIEIEVDLASEPLSATKLKDYLTCKRKFYYKYIERIKEHKIPSDQFEPYQIGNFLHSVFHDIFRKKAVFKNEKELFNEIEIELKKLIKDDIALQFEGDIWLKKLLPFVQNEIERFKDGYEVFLCEKKLEYAFEGMRLEGVIDRIDKKEDKLFIIDYKSGSYPVSLDGKLENTKDFQLVFYEILASTLGKIGGAFYYDLNNSQMIKEEFFSKKKALLQTHIEKYKEKTQTFEMTDEIKECRYCSYKIICQRE